MKQISRDQLSVFFDRIAAKKTLYLPQKTADGSAFMRYDTGDEYCDAHNTTRSAKDFFFPQVETIAAFHTEGKKIEVIDKRNECEDFVIFGARACDVRSFDILDRVFLAAPVDTFYQNRREHGLIISLACNEPEETCFCSAFGIDAAAPAGDISALLTKDTLFLNAISDKGKALLSDLDDILKDAKDKDVDAEKEKIRRILKALPLQNLPISSFTSDRLMERFSDPKWKELSSACLGCGTCTFVCPTCQCFDVRDFDTGHGVERYRCWDSCMYSDFTLMAAAQPRLTQMERFRQRFMHKLVYYPANNDGIFSCVGCGRCMKSCPISMNIVKVMKEIGGENE